MMYNDNPVDLKTCRAGGCVWSMVQADPKRGTPFVLFTDHLGFRLTVHAHHETQTWAFALSEQDKPCVVGIKSNIATAMYEAERSAERIRGIGVRRNAYHRDRLADWAVPA